MYTDNAKRVINNTVQIRTGVILISIIWLVLVLFSLMHISYFEDVIISVTDIEEVNDDAYQFTPFLENPDEVLSQKFKPKYNNLVSLSVRVANEWPDQVDNVLQFQITASDGDCLWDKTIESENIENWQYIELNPDIQFNKKECYDLKISCPVNNNRNVCWKVFLSAEKLAEYRALSFERFHVAPEEMDGNLDLGFQYRVFSWKKYLAFLASLTVMALLVFQVIVFKKKGLLIAVMGMSLALPLYGIFLDSNITLHGVTEEADEVRVDWETLSGGEYQNYLNDLWEKNFPGRKFLIRIRNQILYSIFDKSPNHNVIIGKDNYLFEPGYIDKELMVNGGPNTKEIEELGKKLGYLNKLMDHKGKELYVFITPSKAHYYSDKIPFRYLILDNREKYQMDDVDCLKKSMADHGVSYFDCNSYLEKALQEKAPFKAPLFYKSGIHWSHPWGYACASAFLDYMNSRSRYDLPVVSINETKCAEPIPPDADLYSTLNLILEPKEDWYQAEMNIVQEGKDQPYVFLRGGSFLGQSLGEWFNSGVFEKGVHFQNEFYFLDSSRTGIHLSKRNAYDEMDLKTLISDTDILILEVNVSVVSDMSWGFIDELIEHPEYLE